MRSPLSSVVGWNNEKVRCCTSSIFSCRKCTMAGLRAGICTFVSADSVGTTINYQHYLLELCPKIYRESCATSELEILLHVACSVPVRNGCSVLVCRLRSSCHVHMGINRAT